MVSLAADMVYEGALTGPLLASLGASAVLVGLISGAGEACAAHASCLRIMGRPERALLDAHLRRLCPHCRLRTGSRYYAVLAGAGLALACVLILGERLGKAVRSPAKTALLAHAAASRTRTRLRCAPGAGPDRRRCGPVLVAVVAAAAGRSGQPWLS